MFTANERCLGTSSATLATGDYTIEGYEEDLIIERKGSIGEFANNLCQKRFMRELDRLEEFKWPFLLLEFELNDLIQYPKNMPRNVQKTTRVHGFMLLRKLVEIQLLYKTKIVFVGKHGRDVASSIFKRAIENGGSG